MSSRLRINEVFPENGYIYGSGTFARRLLDVLLNNSVNVLGVIDHNRVGQTLGDFEVKSPSEFNLKDSIVFLGIHNYLADIENIASELSALGSLDLWLPPKVIANLDPESIGDELNNYWMSVDRSIFENLETKLGPLKNALTDSKSIGLLDDIFKYRQTGLLSDLVAPINLAEQYFPEDLDFISPQDEDIHYLDLGAFDGDSLQQMINLGIVPRSYIAIEPELHNFDKLAKVAMAASFPVYCLPFAVSDRAGTVLFSSSERGSAESLTGSQAVTLAPLDSLIRNVKITHIKLDIEGSELAALQGARELLMTWKPNLALSVYHKPDDFWVLFDFIKDLNIYSKFYLRTYGHQTFDTILYCMA